MKLQPLHKPRHPTRRRLLGVTLLLAVTSAHAQTAPGPDTPPVRLRGVIQAVDLPCITVKERSGETLTLTLADKLTFQEVLPISVSAIQRGSFIGTAAVTRADGRLESLEVVVFPEAARGTGEGHYPWDLQPQSSMTNATVADLVQSANGRELTLRYQDGVKRMVVPEGVPVVTFKPGEPARLHRAPRSSSWRCSATACRRSSSSPGQCRRGARFIPTKQRGRRLRRRAFG
jgi:hypothetical protein